MIIHLPLKLASSIYLALGRLVQYTRIHLRHGGYDTIDMVQLILSNMC